MTPTTQFRIPVKTKQLFKDVCTYNNVSMSQIVIQSVEIHRRTDQRPCIDETFTDKRDRKTDWFSPRR